MARASSEFRCVGGIIVVNGRSWLQKGAILLTNEVHALLNEIYTQQERMYFLILDAFKMITMG